MTRFVQGAAHAADRIAEKMNPRHAGQETTLPKDEPGVQMPDDRLLNLGEFGSNHFIVPQKRQRCGIMTKEDYAFVGLERGERLSDFAQVRGS